MILLVDNYDSFVHNLARYFRRLGCETMTLRNDEVDAERVRQLAPQAIVLSPGPCSPNEAGYSLKLIDDFGDSIPIFGVCLGHQAIAQALGGKIIRCDFPTHGRASEIHHNGSKLFSNVPKTFEVGRYHSLVADKKTLPSDLLVTATLADGTIMAVEHKYRPIVGVQFHPESVLTQFGYRILMNFLEMAGVELTVDEPVEVT
jgi:anthranilate synthase/aminodeoxychorismate synthase-like glutamine amidotransferase